uniref:Putative ABC transport system ATP-binding protein n=1 Tax=Tetraselmis sp. GSL018 TaxID=582737 RepID=A0A061R711_9CHLO
MSFRLDNFSYKSFRGSEKFLLVGHKLLGRLPGQRVTGWRYQKNLPVQDRSGGKSHPAEVSQSGKWRELVSDTTRHPEEEPSTSSYVDDTLLELRDVHKAFGSQKILRGCSFKIRRGEAVGVIGASGTGKSTTLRLLAGLLTPDAGEVLVKGVPRRGLISDANDANEMLKIGMVFQSAALFDSLTVGENVGFLLYEHTNLPEARIREIVRESLAEVGLKDVEHLYPSQLSGGMQKRVALARAVVRDDSETKMEQVLMYDEPTAGLDPVASTVVEDLIRSLHKKPTSSEKGGISSYIVVTHQHSTITRAVDRIIFLHKGKVAWEGTAEEFETTTEPIVRQFATGSLQGPIVYG